MRRVTTPDLTIDQMRYVKMLANGYITSEIVQEIWGVTRADDPKAYHNYEVKLSRWRKHPKFDEAWKEELRSFDYSDYSLSRKVLRKAMRQEADPWLSMQSAVNVMNSSGKRIYGDEDRAVTVKVEGLPEIGSPDQE